MGSIPLVLVLLAACGSDPAEPDWGADSGPGNCPAEGTQIDGAYSFGTASAATFQISGHIIGVAGFNIDGTAAYKLGAHDGLSRSLDAIQTYDAATTPISLLVGPKDADCSTAGQCEGFIGRAGTYKSHRSRRTARSSSSPISSRTTARTARAERRSWAP